MIFRKPELRIREYCEIEIYREYDGKHSIDNHISRKDIAAANELYALIDTYDKDQSKRLLQKSKIISKALAKIPNTPLHEISDTRWEETKEHIENVLKVVLELKGFGLARATKILHLKRPELFPILDSYVVAFLLADILGTKSKNLRVGLRCMEIARKTIRKNITGFETLQKSIKDLPEYLSIVRLFDILCWTTAKWDLQGITTAPHGKAERSLLNLNS